MPSGVNYTTKRTLKKFIIINEIFTISISDDFPLIAFKVAVSSLPSLLLLSFLFYELGAWFSSKNKNKNLTW